MNIIITILLSRKKIMVKGAVGMQELLFEFKSVSNPSTTSIIHSCNAM